MLREVFYKGLDEFIDSLEDKKNDKKILDYVMEQLNHIPQEVQKHIAEKTGLFEFSIKGTIEFYPNLRESLEGEEPVRIRVCKGMTCGPRGGKLLLEEVERLMGIEVDESTPDNRFILETQRCFGQCGKGPNIFVDEKAYNKVKIEDIPRILKDAGF